MGTWQRRDVDAAAAHRVSAALSKTLQSRAQRGAAIVGDTAAAMVSAAAPRLQALTHPHAL